MKVLETKIDVREMVISEKAMRNMIFSRSNPGFSNKSTVTRGSENNELFSKLKNLSVIESATKATVLVISPIGYGSGVLLDEGIVVTNLHVAGKGDVEIYFDNRIEIKGRKMEPLLFTKGRTTRFSDRNDLALLKVNGNIPPNITALKIASNANSRAIDVFTIGHPSTGNWTYLEGYIKNNPSIQTWNDKKNGNVYSGKLIEVSLKIEKGFSGGPIVDFKGNLHGINSHSVNNKNFGISFSEINYLLQNKPSFLTNTTEIKKNCGTVPVRQSKIMGRLLGEIIVATKSDIDLNCDSEIDWWVVEPDNPDKAIIHFYLSNLGRPEKIYYDYDRDEVYDFYRLDSNKDGRVDEQDKLQESIGVTFLEL